MLVDWLLGDPYRVYGIAMWVKRALDLVSKLGFGASSGTIDFRPISPPSGWMSVYLHEKKEIGLRTQNPS